MVKKTSKENLHKIWLVGYESYLSQDLINYWSIQVFCSLSNLFFYEIDDETVFSNKSGSQAN